MTPDDTLGSDLADLHTEFAGSGFTFGSAGQRGNRARRQAAIRQPRQRAHHFLDRRRTAQESPRRTQHRLMPPGGRCALPGDERRPVGVRKLGFCDGLEVDVEATPLRRLC